jgi:hypothetical protein
MAKLSFADGSAGRLDINRVSKDVMFEDASVQGSQALKPL